MILFGLLHIAISSLLAYVLSCAFGELSAFVAVASLLGSVAISAWLLNYDSIDFVHLRIGAWRHSTAGVLERIVAAIVIFVGVRHFVFLFYQVDAEIRTLHAFNLGDLPLHVHYIRNLALGVHFPPINPNFPTELLKYPFGIDLYNSLWEILGVPMSSHLMVVGVFLLVASIVCLRLAGSWLLIAAFFFSGGFVSVAEGGPSYVENLLAWKNLFLCMFITQRGFMWALPVGILLFYFLYLGARRKSQNPLARRSLLILGILWGSMAFYHLHTFFILTIMISATFAIRVLKKQMKISDVKSFFYIWIWPVVIGSYFVLLSLNAFRPADSIHIVHWTWGWTYFTSPKHMSFLTYIVINFGVYLLLFFGVATYIFRFKLKAYYSEFFLSLAIFALFFNLILAPWEWDNIKLLVWPYLALTALSYEVLRRHWAAWSQIVLLISLSYGGLYALSEPQFSILKHIALYSTEEIANARGATQDLPVNAVFASGTTYNHELTALGRNRAIGYEGHLWAHGIAYKEKAQQLVDLMNGKENWLELAHVLKVNYIYWGPKEKFEFRTANPQWRSQLKNISRVQDYEIYEVP